MTETYGKTKTRRQAIKRWTCPNHPDGPPTLPADGYEREELTVTEAYGDEFVAALGRLCALRKHDGGLVAQTIGLCCLGHDWKVVGYEMVEVSRLTDMLLAMREPMASAFSGYSVLLGEFDRADRDESTIRIPLILGDKP